jgi:hypothetical protein
LAQLFLKGLWDLSAAHALEIVGHSELPSHKTEGRAGLAAAVSSADTITSGLPAWVMMKDSPLAACVTNCES